MPARQAGVAAGPAGRPRAEDRAGRPPAAGPAEQALALVPVDPHRAWTAAGSVLATARRGGDIPAQVIAERALGLAARELYDAGRAAGHLRRSVRLAERHGLTRRAAESRGSLALVVADLGQPSAAIREVDRAIGALRGLPLARARMQRAVILRRLGREREALAACGAALSRFRRQGDRLWQARALANRGMLHADRGALRRGEADLRAAELLYAELGMAPAVALVRHNLGLLAARAGDIPKALTWYDRADEHFGGGGRPAIALLDRAELLLGARLMPEARRAACAAAQACARARLGAFLPHAQLLLAQAALGAGDRDAARAAARSAGRAFTRQGLHRWAVLARYVAWRAAADGGPPTAARVASARRMTGALCRAGWAAPALEAGIRAAELALALAADGCAAVSAARRYRDGGRPPQAGIRTGNRADPNALADQALAELATAAARAGGGQATLRMRVWHARALVRLHQGDRQGAKRALLAGLRLLDGSRAALGAPELRIHISVEGAELAAEGLRLALADRAPRDVLAWAERCRALGLRSPPPPARDRSLARTLAQLRRVGTQLAAGGGERRLGRLMCRQRALEDAVRRASWRAAGAGPIGPGARVAAAVAGPATSAPGVPGAAAVVPALCAELGERALVELVAVDGALLAVVVAGGRVRLRPLGPVACAQREAVALRFALRRLALRHGSQPSLAAAAECAEAARARLDSLLLAPLARWLNDRPLVIVPTGGLHALPWPALPGLRGRAAVVAPSATAWLRAARTPAPAGGRTVLVAPHDPPHALAEVRAIARVVPTAALLAGAAARVRDVLTAVDGARGAHLAAHGKFRADNPFFSHLCLADGPLTGYDLMQLRRPPGLIVLSGCDTAVATVHPGDELLGLAWALLGQGTRTLVASVGPVDDETTRALMVDLHRRLRTGAAPAAALAAAQAAAPAEAWYSTHSFVCIGAG